MALSMDCASSKLNNKYSSSS